MDKINQLKIEVFDILAAMDNIKFKLQELEQLKNKKIQDLNDEINKPKDELDLEKDKAK